MPTDETIDPKSPKLGVNDLTMIGEIIDSSIDDQTKNNSRVSKLKQLRKMWEASDSPFKGNKNKSKVIVSPKSLKQLKRGPESGSFAPLKVLTKNDEAVNEAFKFGVKPIFSPGIPAIDSIGQSSSNLGQKF